MMGPAELGLGIIPPVFAILVEALNPVSEAVIESSARRDFASIGREWAEMAQAYIDCAREHGREIKHANVSIAVAQQQLIETAAKFGVGVRKVAGAGPTLVSVVSSGFAVLHEIPNPFWPALGYVLVFMLIALWLLYVLGGRSFFEIGSAAYGPKIRGKRHLTRARVAAIAVYFANGVLIMTSITVFLLLREC